MCDFFGNVRVNRAAQGLFREPQLRRFTLEIGHHLLIGLPLLVVEQHQRIVRRRHAFVRVNESQLLA